MCLSKKGTNWVFLVSPSLLQHAALVVVPLGVGGILYLLYRPATLRLFSWADAVGLLAAVEAMREGTTVKYEHMPSWVIYSLPNGLWLFALCYFMYAVWEDVEDVRRWIWLPVGLLLGPGIEVLQAFDIVPGVFDMWDIVWMMCALSAVFVIDCVSMTSKGR